MEAANTAAQTAEGGVHVTRSAYRQHRQRAVRTEARTENSTNHQRRDSHRQQKRAIKQEYANARRTTDRAAEAAQTSAKTAEKTAEKGKRVVQYIVRHRKGLPILGIAALMAIMLLSTVSSCSVLLQSGMSGLAVSSYPSADADLQAAEEQYSAMEAELQAYLDNFEDSHSYDEYHYNLDAIEHDPYVLISMLSALHPGAWTADEVQELLQTIFDRQYTLTETVTTETRYDNNGNPYLWTVCTVTLENFNLSHLPVYMMSEEQLSMYATYMTTLGNRPDLFPTSEYVGLITAQRPSYQIPPEALADAQFAAMIAEAEKYLGYPYVWGGSSPSTSFDCSGFVSWVINHSGWSVGRLGAQGLCDISTPVRATDARPGDLIFFVGTYDTPGVSHVGIYVGNGMMIHCGNPIQYTSVETSYWQQHFYCYGRLPNP